jgi:hypothetical protein
MWKAGWATGPAASVASYLSSTSTAATPLSLFGRQQWKAWPGHWAVPSVCVGRYVAPPPYHSTSHLPTPSSSPSSPTHHRWQAWVVTPSQHGFCHQAVWIGWCATFPFLLLWSLCWDTRTSSKVGCGACLLWKKLNSKNVNFVVNIPPPPHPCCHRGKVVMCITDQSGRAKWVGAKHDCFGLAWAWPSMKPIMDHAFAKAQAGPNMAYPSMVSHLTS